MMEELIEVYKYDLELFEYDYDKYLNCTTDSVRLEQVKQNWCKYLYLEFYMIYSVYTRENVFIYVYLLCEYYNGVW